MFDNVMYDEISKKIDFIIGCAAFLFLRGQVFIFM